MPQHVVVDGSNIATEGRSQPSLQQLNEAVLAFIAEHPSALITVVVDATFGHRIDPREVPDFDDAVSNNELVAPPAGAIGRGDAFVLSIANKVNANILSNDSYQEFHGEYAWLFDEGRLIGGKPVPHVGWVFVNRLPVRGPTSRKSLADAKRKGGRGRGGKADDGNVRVGSPEASKPMPVPSAPPPGAMLSGKAQPKAAQAKAVQARAIQPKPAPKGGVPAEQPTAKQGQVNDLLTFLSFVEHHPVGTSVNAVVDHYSSHGAYVKIGDVVGYVPLRLMASPAPRSAREFMKVGESITLVVESFVGAKRSIDLAVPGMGSAVLLVDVDRPKRGRRKAEPAAETAAVVEPAELAEPAPAKARRTVKKAVPATEPAAESVGVEPVVKKPAAKPARTAARKAAAVPAATAATAAKPAKTAKTAKPAKPAKTVKAAAQPTKTAAEPAKKAAAKKAPAKKVAAKKAPAKKAAG